MQCVVENAPDPRAAELAVPRRSTSCSPVARAHRARRYPALSEIPVLSSPPGPAGRADLPLKGRPADLRLRQSCHGVHFRNEAVMSMTIRAWRGVSVFAAVAVFAGVVGGGGAAALAGPARLNGTIRDFRGAFAST